MSNSTNLRHKPASKMAVKRKTVRGHKGGDKPKSPVETPDSLRSIAYAKILDLVSEGQIYGFVSGTGTDVLKDIYLDETPIANSDGSLNFKNVQVDTRAGTQNQDYIKSFPAVENEISVNTELKDVAPWSRASTNLTLSALRVRLSVNALSKSDLTTGDIKGYRIEYAIDLAVDGGAFVEVMKNAFDGKSSSVYERSHRIDLPEATSSGWVIRVRRLTANAGSAYIADTTNIVSLTEIIDAKFRYPNSALVGIQIDASQFQNIPRRAYHLKGRIIQVPTNYNPDTRVYTGTWDGTFKAAWTDNPAWIFYDLATHPRYGLGNLISATLVDKWSLYGIAQYCDELVPDGNGGTEPRFTCNLFLQQQADAYKVLQDLASVFRGICYWSNGSIVPVADRPSDPVYIYTNANVVSGQFRYEGSGRRARHTVALVSWSDPADFGRAKVEYVEDPVGVARYGVQQTEIIAVGCTSQSGAQRIGRWALLTERLETNTCTWTVGLDGTYAVPGQIVQVADRNRAGRRIGGRISSMAANKLSAVIDSPIGVDPVAGDSFSVVGTDGVLSTRTVSSYNAGTKTVTVSVAFPNVAVSGAAWSIQTNSLAVQNYRVLSVTETTDDTKGFVIVGLEHNDSKFDAVDFGTAIDIPNTSVIPSSVQLAPASITLSSAERAGSVVSALSLTASWPAAPGAVKYRIQWKKGNGNWGPKIEVTGLSAELGDTVFPDIYKVRVYAVNALNIVSTGKTSAELNVADQLKQPTSLQTALANAAAAASQAAAANSDIANMVSDNILSKVEKKRLIIDYNQIINDKPALDSQATTFSLSAAAYDLAITNLTNYLTGLTPTWSDITQNTTVVGATLRSKFADVYTARQNLLNAIAGNNKGYADAAQTAANSAASAASAAQTSANAANAEITNISSDNVLSKAEKPRVILDWNAIANDKAGIDAQATAYGITTEKTNYDNSYTALSSYLTGLTPLWSDTTQNTTIVGSTFRANFNDLYTKRQVLLNKIATIAKSLADAAQSTADSAASAAAAAQTAANNAQATGNAAATDIANIASDNVLSVVEKKRVLNDWNAIANEKAGIDAQAAQYGIDDDLTAYDSAYSALQTYLSGLTSPVAWSNLTGITTVVGTTFRSYFANYYQAKVTLLQHIADVTMYGADYTPGEILCPNPNFTQNKIKGPLGTYRLQNKPLCDGWDVYNYVSIVANSECGIYMPALGSIRADIFGQTALSSPGTRFSGAQTPRIPVQAGKTYEFFYTCTASYNGSMPAGVVRSHRMAIHWYDSTGAQVGSYSNVAGPATAIPNAGSFYGTAIAPAGAVSASVDFGAYITNSSGANWTHNSSVALSITFTNVGMRKLEDLAVPGSGYRIGNQGNLPPVRTGSTGSRWSGAAITYSIPTTGSPAVVTFNVASGSLVAGSFIVAYSASSGTVSQARSTTATYYLYYQDANYDGGTRTLNITTNAANISNADDRVWIGDATVTTPALGTGGGGSGGGGGSCVDGAMWIDAERQAQDIQAGDLIDIVDPRKPDGTPRKARRRVTRNEVRIVPCYLVRTEAGAVLRAGETTPFTLRDGSSKLIGDMMGEEVLVDCWGRLRWERVIECRSIGNRPVCHISVDNGSYFAGEDCNNRVASHNSLKP